ncbi:MAG: ABC transporter permease [Saprospiraceae bacterium]|nr:ABC transporter permease [Saprospiraceae bacterium]
MNLEHFIAKRISFSGRKSFTGIIVMIAIAAIALSLSIMIITSAIITGFKKEISEKIVSFWGDIHINDSNINRSFEQIPIDDARDLIVSLDSIKYVEYEDDKRILGVPIKGQRVMNKTKGGIRSVQGTIMAPGLMRTREDYNGIILKGIGEDFDWDRLESSIIEGKRIEFPESASSDDILVSKYTASRMKLSVGDRVLVSFIKDRDHIKRRFEVSGIYNTGLEEYDSKVAMVDISEIRSILGWSDDQVGNIEILVDNQEDLDILSEYIYYEELPAHLFSSTIRQKLPGIFEWLKLQDINEQIIMALMVIVGIINMITVLLILILERSKMIGILKAVGATNWSVRKIFLYNSGYIVFFGLVIGNVIGLLFCFLQERFSFITLDEESYYLAVAPIDLNIISILLINVGSFVVILSIMLLPTLLISWISPIKVLRFE